MVLGLLPGEGGAVPGMAATMSYGLPGRVQLIQDAVARLQVHCAPLADILLSCCELDVEDRMTAVAALRALQSVAVVDALASTVGDAASTSSHARAVVQLDHGERDATPERAPAPVQPSYFQVSRGEDSHHGDTQPLVARQRDRTFLPCSADVLFCVIIMVGFWLHVASTVVLFRRRTTTWAAVACILAGLAWLYGLAIVFFGRPTGSVRTCSHRLLLTVAGLVGGGMVVPVLYGVHSLAQKRHIRSLAALTVAASELFMFQAPLVVFYGSLLLSNAFDEEYVLSRFTSSEVALFVTALAFAALGMCGHVATIVRDFNETWWAGAGLSRTEILFVVLDVAWHVLRWLPFITAFRTFTLLAAFLAIGGQALIVDWLMSLEMSNLPLFLPISCAPLVCGWCREARGFKSVLLWLWDYGVCSITLLVLPFVIGSREYVHVHDVCNSTTLVADCFRPWTLYLCVAAASCATALFFYILCCMGASRSKVDY